jgi:hypothetical protein
VGTDGLLDFWEMVAVFYWPKGGKALKKQITTNFFSASEKLCLSIEIRTLLLMRMHAKYRQFCVFFVCVYTWPLLSSHMFLCFALTF